MRVSTVLAISLATATASAAPIYASSAEFDARDMDELSERAYLGVRTGKADWAQIAQTGRGVGSRPRSDGNTDMRTYLGTQNGRIHWAQGAKGYGQ
ncbi:hypothetical protein EVJ58_g6071, partial [Rhodofomes roseus]